MSDNLHLNVISMDEKHDAFLVLLEAVRTSNADTFLSLLTPLLFLYSLHF